MNDQTVQGLIDCLERLLKHGGIQTLEDAGTAIQRLSEVLNQVRPFCNRERLSEWLSQVEVSADDELLIRWITESLPAVSVALLRRSIAANTQGISCGKRRSA